MIVESYEDVLVLSGCVNSNQWGTIETAIELLLERHPSGLIVDCSGITEISQAGGETFHHAIDFVNSHEARIIFAAVPSNVLDILRNVPEVRSQLALAASVHEARTSLDLLHTDDHGKKKKEKPRAINRTVLAVACPGRLSDSFGKFIEDLISRSTTKVVLALPIIVPRDLPLQAPMPTEEAEAAQCAKDFESRLLERNIAHKVVLERTRDIPGLVAELAAEVGAEYVLVSLPDDHRNDEESTKLFYALLDKVDRSLVFVRGEVSS